MPLGDFQRFFVEKERGAAVRSEHAPHLGKRFRVERVEPVLSRILPVEGRAAHDGVDAIICQGERRRRRV